MLLFCCRGPIFMYRAESEGRIVRVWECVHTLKKCYAGWLNAVIPNDDEVIMRCDEMIPCEIDDDVVNFLDDTDHKFSLTFPTYLL